MEFMEWRDDYTLGMPIVDLQHRQLFDLANSLAVAQRMGRPGEVRELFIEFAGQMETHFRTEEDMMATASYADFTRHKREHDAVRNRLTSLLIRTRGGQTPPGLAELDVFKGWFTIHLLGADREMGDFFRLRAAA